MKKSLIIPIIGLIILGVSAFLFFNKNEERDNKNVTLPSSLFDTVDFYDMKPLNQKELDDFYIVNFFASWCKPCLAEHPLLMELQSKGIKIIGINFRDDEENFVKWINEHGNPFFHIIRDDGSFAYEMGLIGVPETFFIENSEIQKKVQGPLFYEDIQKYL
ncbi:thioredoxin-like domain-containing protein [Alphaproteobacteria bacterium]|nr:thioredoxin-like domain-containing protein [Alphaproteobacteria bacterium]